MESTCMVVNKIGQKVMCLVEDETCYHCIAEALSWSSILRCKKLTTAFLSLQVLTVLLEPGIQSHVMTKPCVTGLG